MITFVYHAAMREFAHLIPNPDVLIALEPEELGAKIIFLLQKRQLQRDMFMPSVLTNELVPQPSYPNAHFTPYQSKAADVELALTEALAWLEAQGLIVPAPEPNGRGGWRRLSRRARRFVSEGEFANYKTARLLPKEALHPRIADVAWGDFMRGLFDGAAFHAMKAVEVSVRQASGLGNDLVGQQLMRKAFAPHDGPLTDMTAESSERQGRSDLFAGVIASYKNPQSHRDVNLDDPQEALEIIYLANHLLRIVDARVKAKGEGVRE